MKYLSLLLLSSIFLIPVAQSAHAQGNILDQIGQAFQNLTGMGQQGGQQAGNQTGGAQQGGQQDGEGTGQGGAGGQGAAPGGQMSGTAGQGIGTFEELRTLTQGNQELLENGTSIAPENRTFGQELERQQFTEAENITGALTDKVGGDQPGVQPGGQQGGNQTGGQQGGQ